jgi:hypothetical protein
LTVAGNDVIGGAISNVNVLNISGTTNLGANVSTTGSQTFGGAVTLAGDAALLATSNTAVITIGNSLNSDTTPDNLTINASGTSGSVVLNGTLGNASALGTLTVNATTITMNGSSVNSTGNQTYTGAVTLAQNTVLQSTGANASIAVANSINSDSAANRTLNITASGAGSAVSLGGTVGATNQLSQVDVTASAIALNGGSIRASGNETFTGAVTLGANTTLTAANVTTSANSTIAGVGKSLGITGNLSLGAAVSNVSQFSVSGATSLAGNVSSIGNQTYTGAMTLSGNSVLLASGDGAVISTSGAVNSDGTARALTMSATGANASVVFNHAIGSTAALASLSTTGSEIVLNGPTVNTTGNQTYAGSVRLASNTTLTGANVATTQGSVVVGAGNSVGIVGNASLGGVVSNVSQFSVSGTTQLAGNVSSTGNQTYTGAITLGGDSALLANGTNAVITTSGAINSDGTTRSLTFTASGANSTLVFNEAIGNTAAIGSLNATASNITLNGSQVKTTGKERWSCPCPTGRRSRNG